MRTDHIAYQRATQVAVIGLALQFLFTLTVLIFGLIFATLLTLGVVPVLYSLFYRVDFRATRPDPAFQ